MTKIAASQILRSLASSWLALAVGVAISFFLSPFVVNKLGSVWYGVWAVASQFVGYLYLLDFGVRESVIRYTSKHAARGRQDALNRVLTTAISLYSAVAVVTIIAVGCCVWAIPHLLNLEPDLWTDARWALALAGITIAQAFIFNVFDGVIIGLQRWDIGNIFAIAWALVRAALIVIFLSQGHGIVAIAAIQCGISLLAGMTSSIIATSLLRKRSMSFRLARLTGRRLRALARRLLGYGAYVVVNNLGEKIIHASGAIVAGIILPIQSVTYYAIAGSLAGYLRSLLGATSQIFNPLASHLRELRQSSELKSAFLLGVKLVVILTIPVATAFIVLGERFIALWMGTEFAEPAGRVLAIFGGAAILAAPQYVISSVLYGISRHNVIAALRVAEAIINLALSIWLAKTIGLNGVALGAAIPSVLIVMLVTPRFACPIVGIRLGEYFLQIYARAVVAFAPFALAAWWIDAKVPAGSLLVFFMQVAGLTLVYAPWAFVTMLSSKERSLVLARLGLKVAYTPASTGISSPD